MALHPAVAARLEKLAPDQRAAATAPPGPVLCVAPAGSGKTTTLVARIAWLVDTGTPAGSICAVTFNKRAAEELSERLTAALEPLGVAAGAVRVRTFHALGREMLRSSGASVDPLIDRVPLLRRLVPGIDAPRLRLLDDRFSRWKLDRGLRLADVEAFDVPVDGSAEFIAYERAIRDAGGLDFDDLVVRALDLLVASPAATETWRAACRELLVDEVQDVDRTQLQLALHLAAPANRIFLVGDDDQSIYGWRLADVRRVLALADLLPGLRRIDLVTNYRCPAPVVRRAVRLIETNTERFVKEVRPGPRAQGALVLAPDGAGGEAALRRFLGSPLAEGSTRAVLARTNRELLLPLAIALESGIPFRATARLLLEEAEVDVLLARLAVGGDEDAGRPLLLRLGALRTAVLAEARPDDPEAVDPRDVVTAMLGWAAAAPGETATAFGERIAAARRRLAELRRDDASLILATAHGTKGLEFDEVAVIGMDDGRFPSQRTLAEAADPARVLEEERRLAYVAWTRARRLLTLIYDPMRPSPFLLEAFSREELDLPRGAATGSEPVGGRRPRAGSSGGGTKAGDGALEVGAHGPGVAVVQPARRDAVQ
jgi:superfamily I DNA/RNA helicase